jgi:hypothetical protein
MRKRATDRYILGLTFVRSRQHDNVRPRTRLCTFLHALLYRRQVRHRCQRAKPEPARGRAVTAGPSEIGAGPENQKRAERVSAAREPSQTYRDAQTIAADSTRDAQQPRQRKGADESSQKSQGRTSAGSCDARCESSWQSRAGRSTTGTNLHVRAICAAAQSGCINCRTKADQSADPRWQIIHLEHMVWAHMRARPRESKRDRSCRRQQARGSAGDVRMSESD